MDQAVILRFANRDREVFPSFVAKNLPAPVRS